MKKMIINKGQYDMIKKFAQAPVKASGQAVPYDDEVIDIESDISSGPWDHEPDEVMLEHAGYVCELKRHPSLGTWCGYVYVGEEHPLFKNTDEDGACDFLNVHGGVTYKHEGKFGFDCNHAGDFTPHISWGPAGKETYRTVEYATNEVKSLAQQLRNYDSAYHRRMFEVARKLDDRAESIRKALRKKGQA